LLDNLQAFEFELNDNEMEKLSALNRNLRKIIPVVKLTSGEVILRDGKSRHFPFAFEEKVE
jgi:diketogulonate reductase-like aldo/keto reductase